MDLRRLQLLPMATWRFRYFLHWIFRRRNWRNAWSYLLTTLFSRDAGLALLDPVYRIFPQLAPYPRETELEVTTACHLRCRMCEHTYWNEKPKHMSYEQFMHIMKMFPDLNWIGLTGIGSGFLNPDYMRMLSFLKRERRCFVEFFDHFHLIKREWLDDIVRMGVDKIWVSLENARAESYNKARVGSDFDTVIDNLKYLIELKRKHRSPFPELWFHFIITRDNIAEMEEYVDLVADLCAPIMHISPPLIFWTNLLGFDEVRDLCVQTTPEMRARVQNKCRERGLFFAWNENTTCDQPMRRCTKWTEPFVLVTGHIQPCCALNEANNRPYQEKHAYLNVFEKDFHEFWYGEGMKQFLRTIHEGGINDACKFCHIFQHPGIERLRPHQESKS